MFDKTHYVFSPEKWEKDNKTLKQKKDKSMPKLQNEAYPDHHFEEKPIKWERSEEKEEALKSERKTKIERHT